MSELKQTLFRGRYRQSALTPSKARLFRAIWPRTGISQSHDRHGLRGRLRRHAAFWRRV